MAPVIHFVRHAQGYHNLSLANHSMPDPILTEFGEEQCQKLARDFPYHDSVGAIVASPLRRTIYTALYGFKPLIDKGIPVIALPELSETADVPCDTGSDVGVLQEEMKDKPVDLSMVKDGWNVKTGRFAPVPNALVKRARDVRQWLKARPEEEIVVVTHGKILHYITEEWSDYNKAWGTGWRNVEYRSYYFTEEKGDNASLAETERSREARCGSKLPLTEEERMKSHTTATTMVDGDPHTAQVA